MIKDWLKQYEYHKNMSDTLHSRLDHDVINLAKRIWDERRDQRIELEKAGVRDFPCYGTYKDAHHFEWEIDEDNICVTSVNNNHEWGDDAITLPSCLLGDEAKIASYVKTIYEETEAKIGDRRKQRQETLDDRIAAAQANLERLLREKNNGG